MNATAAPFPLLDMLVVEPLLAGNLPEGAP